MNIEVGTKIKVTNTDYPESVPNGTIMTVVFDYRCGGVEASIDGCDGYDWYMEDGTYEVIQDTLTIQEGKYYRTRDGRKVGPIEKYDGDGFSFRCGGSTYNSYGGYYSIGESEHDIIAEWTDDEGEPVTGTLAELQVKPGDVVECVDSIIDWWTVGKQYTVTDDGTPQDDYGKTYGELEDPQPAITFRIISRAPDLPKTWGEMTDAEKGALLLAVHEGRKLQRWHFAGVWVDCDKIWSDNIAYRIKPEPVRETVEIYGGCDDQVPQQWRSTLVGPYRITFDIIDGKPDLDSIKMEALG